MKNKREFLSKLKITEDYEDADLAAVEKCYHSLNKYYYDLFDAAGYDFNKDFEAGKEFFSSDDWKEFKELVRKSLEALDETFEKLSDYKSREARIHKGEAISIINMWNHFADLAYSGYRTSLDLDDDEAYSIMSKALDTDGWAISNIPKVSEMITL